MIIAAGSLRPESLAGRVAIVTGAGTGIGFEAARALLWLGASVTIAEVDEAAGAAAVERLTRETPGCPVLFVATDVSDEASVAHTVAATREAFGPVDIVLNNATFAPVGERVEATPVEHWDRSYAVNLRGPVLLARACLPAMIDRGSGVFVCVSSTGGPYLGAYETLKAAQLALADTLDGELAGTGVVAYTIGPGLVPTATAVAAVELIAPRLGLTLDEFYTMNRGALLSVEAAGAGFAASVVLAEQYAGQEVSSSQALIDAGIAIPEDGGVPAGVTVGGAAAGSASAVRGGADVVELCATVAATLAEQARTWRERPLFERQWMVRDFRKRAGMPVESWLETLEQLADHLRSVGDGPIGVDLPSLGALAAFYGHLGDLARGYVKDPAERDAQLAVVRGWRDEVERLQARLGG